MTRSGKLSTHPVLHEKSSFSGALDVDLRKERLDCCPRRGLIQHGCCLSLKHRLRVLIRVLEVGQVLGPEDRFGADGRVL